MPRYSDNLYSADDSDVGSLSDALSPTDGYFEDRGHPQEMLVEDPSLGAGSTAESKAQEARRESAANSQEGQTPSVDAPLISRATPSQQYIPATTAAYAPSSLSAQASHSSVSPHRRTSDTYTETSSLLRPAPPPAYSPATSPTFSTPATNFNGNYSTITSSQVEEGQVPHREPESMGGPPEDLNNRTPLYTREIKFSRARKCMKSCLLMLLTLVIMVSLLMTLIKAGLKSDGNFHHGKPDDEKQPNNPIRITPGEPAIPWEPIHPGLPSTGKSYCPTATIHRSHYPEYEFTQGGQLNILQTHKDTGSSSGTYVQTAGKLILRRLPQDRKDSATGFVTFDIWTTDDDLTPEVQLDQHMKAIKAYTPSHAEGLNPTHQHCISLEITVWIPWNATFDDIQVFTSQLAIEVYDDIHVHSERTASFETLSGHVTWPAINQDDPTFKAPPHSESRADIKATQLFRRRERGITSREIRIHTSSGSVNGAFSLYDLLSITTLSGSIDISVAPQEAGIEEKPAVLELETKSSSITARLPTFASPVIPKRDYHTSVTTLSGNIKGSFYIGAECKIMTKSSSVKAYLLPGLTSGKSHLFTESYSGSTEIEVLSPPSTYGQGERAPDKWIDIGDSDPYLLPPPPPTTAAANTASRRPTLTNLYSEHHSQSGTTKLLYPSEWEGKITVASYSGSIKVGGEDVRTISDGKDWGGLRRVIAKKGTGSSVLDMRSKSGSTDVWVGLGGW